MGITPPCDGIGPGDGELPGHPEVLHETEPGILKPGPEFSLSLESDDYLP